MGSKEDIITDKAIEVFSRYGVRRTTMGDIAKHAGVSRQTLYSHFANKDEVLRAAIRSLAAATIAQIKASWQQDTSMSAKLDTYLEFAVVKHFEALSKMPDSSDLLNGYSEEGLQELRKLERQKMKLLQNQFEPHHRELSEKGSSAADLAELFERSSCNFKYIATSKPHLKRLLKTLKTSTMMMLGE